MTNYQRGTDLLNCPRNCQHAACGLLESGVEVFAVWETYDFVCDALREDTCPREQAERVCASCESLSDVPLSEMVTCNSWRTYTSPDYTCPRWKERTNG